MEIYFTRHSKRRAKLYGISESIIREVINNADIYEGQQEILKRVTGFKYPLKIVISAEGNTATVLTNYPLKKGDTNEGAIR
jgi:hypothetical protein